MGEVSKRSGEIGEKIATALLAKLGWKTTLRNVSIECNTPSHLNEMGKQRHSHGDDQIFLYNNPFHDNRTDIVHVSSKNHIDKYPSDATLKTKFKEHVKELHQIIECAKFNPGLQQVITDFKSKKNKVHVGLLIWLHEDETDIEHDIKPTLSNIRLDQDFSTPIYLIDNERATFLLSMLDDIQRRTKSDAVDFYYPKIGTTISVDEERSGILLPLELLASDIIPIKWKKKDAYELVVYANQNFNLESYKKLIEYGLNFCGGLLTTVHIGMPNYNVAHHENIAQQARLSFPDRKENVIPFSFNRSIISLIHDEGNLNGI